MEAFRIRGPGQASVMDADREVLCVDMLQPHEVSFSQENHHLVQPANDKPPQWHGIFTVRQPTTEAVFVTQLSLDCQSSAVTVESLGAAGIKVQAGEHQVIVDPMGAFTLN
jgi:hypothetical protein